MTVSHDPRPASRYQAVTPSDFRHQMGAREASPDTLRVPAARPRLLRHVPVQLVRLAIGG